MADADDILPVPPPAEPSSSFEQPSTPEPAEPTSPFVQPSPVAPREPVDVTTGPRHEPDLVRGDTLDEVPQPPGLSLPPPPWEPTDVTIQPSAPPGVPFDVTVVPSAPPALPTDVSTPLSGPSPDPVDVPTPPSAPPGDAADVTTTPGPAPADPFDVVTTAPPAPDEPTDVPIVVVRDHRNEPGTQPVPPLELSAPPAPGSIQGTIDRIGLLDRGLVQMLQGLTSFDPLTLAGPGGASMDPIVLARWFRDYLGSVGRTGLAEFITQQSILYAMNPVVSRVFNPAYFQMMLVPGSMGHVTTTIDTAAGITMENVVKTADAVARTLPDPPIPGVDVPANGEQNVYSSDRRYEDGQVFSLEEMTRAAQIGIPGRALRAKEPEAGSPVSRFDASRFFFDGPGGKSIMRAGYVATKPANIKGSPLSRAAGTNGIVPASFPGELEDYTFETTTDEPSTDVGGLSDDDAYVPLAFTDLRPAKSGKYRTVYFRPFNLSFSENIGPEFEEDVAFGRTDPVVGYVRTVRSFDVSFECHAFAVEDLKAIHTKLVWLKSMAYPSYSIDALLKSGPVLRLRVGDVISSGAKGVPGILRSLAFDHSDSLWELNRGSKVTRSVGVSLSFLALHEGPIGFLDGDFGELSIPSIGGDQTAVSVVPGRFQGFGEPTRRR